MVLRLLIDAVHTDEMRVVIADGTRIHDFDFVTAAKKQVKGNIYLAKITRVEPSLQAAFVEYGGGKQGFLPFAEIHPDYYQIPTADRKRLLEEAEGAEEEDGDSEPPSSAETAADAAELKADTHSENAPGFPEAPSAQDSLPAYTASEPEQFPAQESPAIIAQTHETAATYSDPVSEPQAAATEPAAETHSEPGEGGEAQEIETLASDEDAVRQTRSASFYRRYKIQEVIKRNQIVLVQVIKEERGNKGVSLTTFISLAGRYCVLMPNSPKGGGISRKIMSGEDRKRLKEISAELKTARGMSAIIRTAGIDRTRAEIKRDYEYLVKLWESIREQTLSSTAPALIYEEGDLIKRTIRDLYTADIEEIVVEGEAGFNQAKDFLKMILPSHAPRVKLHQEAVPLFYSYNIEDQLASMYDPIVKLRSGGYIVLNPTEALISIDVNSGRSTGERNIEETATKTNLEAAAEIARQLRLRDLAGLIVIDFIDMMDSRNRRSIERALKDALKLDRAKIQIGRISPFGLLEMSRQRLRPSLSETSTMPCPHCQGKGAIRSDASVAIQIIRAMEKEAASGLLSEIKVTVTPSVALHLLNSRREALTAMEEKYSLRILILTDASMPQGGFRLDKIKGVTGKRGGPGGNVQEPVTVVMDDLPPVDEAVTGEDAEILVSGDSVAQPAYEERPHRRGRRGGRGRRDGRNFNDRDRGPRPAPAMEGQEVALAEVSQETTQEGAPAGGGRPPRDRGERGGRGRRPRRWRDRRDRYEGGSNAPANASGAPTGEPNGAAHRGNESHEHAAAPRHLPPVSNASVPPLAQQATADAKPKKGWWRKIIES